MPIVARDLLHGGAQTYGVMLGAFGMGAVIGALNISTLRGRLGDEVSIRLCMIVMGVCVAVVAISRSPALTGSALVFAGAAWTASVTVFNVGVQLAAPRWVAGRALAAYQAAIAGGIALGSWAWGSIANVIGVEGALLISGATLFASPVLGLWMRMPTVSGPNELSLDVLADPEVRLSLTPRSGPIVVEIEYRVDPAKARLFYAVMQHVQLSRQRNGAYGWSIARDIADPELWTERFHCPTWHDYLRQRSRSTASERALHLRANEFHIGPEPIRIRRMLERPSDLCAGKRTRPIDQPRMSHRLRARGAAPEQDFLRISVSAAVQSAGIADRARDLALIERQRDKPPESAISTDMRISRRGFHAHQRRQAVPSRRDRRRCRGEFAVFSAHASRVDVCIFAAQDGRELERCMLRERRLTISALNASGNPLHPGDVGPKDSQLARDAIALQTVPLRGVRKERAYIEMRRRRPSPKPEFHAVETQARGVVERLLETEGTQAVRV